ERSVEMTTSPSDARQEAGARRTRDLSGRRTIAGLFRNRDDAERAINELKAAGFTGDQIGIVMRDRNEQGEMVEQTGTHAAAGAVLVTVEPRGRAQEAQAILERNGADTGTEAMDAARDANALPAGDGQDSRDSRDSQARRVENSATLPAAVPVPDLNYRRPGG